MITKSKALITLHAGPASLRFTFFDTAAELLRLVARGRIIGLGASPRMEVEETQELPAFAADISAGGESFQFPDALRYLLRFIHDHWSETSTLAAVGHMVAHGGAEFVVPTVIGPDVINALHAIAPLAPEELPANLAAICAVTEVRPDLPQVACFDTAFHRGRPRVSEETGLPADFFERGIRRWGFLGLACESVTAQLAELAPHLAAGRILIAHLGETTGLCALRGNRSIETSVGFSRFEGLPCGTRAGSLDPSALFYLQRQMATQELAELLSERSGLLGISGITGEVKGLLASRHPRAAHAIDYFVYRLVREIGSMTAALGGIDALVFTGEIGENAPAIRDRICRALDWLGIELNSAINDGRGERACISRPGRSPSVWVIPTDEQRVIAGHTLKILSMLPPRKPATRRTAGDDPASRYPNPGPPKCSPARSTG